MCILRFVGLGSLFICSCLSREVEGGPLSHYLFSAYLRCRYVYQCKNLEFQSLSVRATSSNKFSMSTVRGSISPTGVDIRVREEIFL